MTKVATADAGALSTEHVMYTAVATAAAAAADDDKEDALVPSTNSRVLFPNSLYSPGVIPCIDFTDNY